MNSATLVVDAPAKVNLFLRVLHRRLDGYREIETLFQAISLADRVEVTVAETGTRPATVTLEVEGPDLGPAEHNLAFLAASRFVEASARAVDVHVRLVKHVPAGAGLGGGSSDAAAVLRALARLTAGPGARGPDGGGRLRELGIGLGSDVPFLLGPAATALARGRGELLTAVPDLAPAPLVIALPPVHVATGPAYAALAGTRTPHDSDPHGGPRPLEGASMDWGRIAALAENDFEPIVRARHPEVAKSLDGLRRTRPAMALLSGSGAACFAVYEDGAVAEAAAAELTERLGWPFLVAHTLRSFPEPRPPDLPRGPAG